MRRAYDMPPRYGEVFGSLDAGTTYQVFKLLARLSGVEDAALLRRAHYAWGWLAMMHASAGPPPPYEEVTPPSPDEEEPEEPPSPYQQEHEQQDMNM